MKNKLVVTILTVALVVVSVVFMVESRQNSNADEKYELLEAQFNDMDVLSRTHNEIYEIHQLEYFDTWILSNRQGVYSWDKPEMYYLELDFKEDVLYGTDTFELKAEKMEDLYNELVKLHSLLRESIEKMDE